MSKLWLLLILLTIPLVLSASCNEGDGCNQGCLNGDKDCSCKILKGYECTSDQACHGTLMENNGKKICCSIPCVQGENLEENSKVVVLSEKPEEKTKSATGFSQTKNKLGLGFVILMCAASLLLLLKKLLRRFKISE